MGLFDFFKKRVHESANQSLNSKETVKQATQFDESLRNEYVSCAERGHDWGEEWGGFKTTCQRCGYVDEDEVRCQIEWSYI